MPRLHRLLDCFDPDVGFPLIRMRPVNQVEGCAHQNAADDLHHHDLLAQDHEGEQNREQRAPSRPPERHGDVVHGA